MAHVLLPTDFSDNALNAALYALRLFGDEGNTFTVVHSYGLTLNESGEPLPVMDPVASIATEQTAEFIARVRTALPGRKPVMNTACGPGGLVDVISALRE